MSGKSAPPLEDRSRKNYRMVGKEKSAKMRDLGMRMSGVIGTNMSLRQVAKELGYTSIRACEYDSYVALGKFVHRARIALGLEQRPNA